MVYHPQPTLLETSSAIAEVASSADIAEVASSADFAGGVTIEMAPSAVAGVASPADLAEVASSADFAGGVSHRRSGTLGRCWGGVPSQILLRWHPRTTLLGMSPSV